MKDLVMTWKANHDIQYVLNAHSCVMYICGYMAKAPQKYEHLTNWIL